MLIFGKISEQNQKLQVITKLSDFIPNHLLAFRIKQVSNSYHLPPNSVAEHPKCKTTVT